MQILSTLSGIFAIYAAYLLSVKVLRDRYWALLPPILLAGSGDFVFYMGVGLEQVLFVGLTALAIAELWDQPDQAMTGNRLAVIFTLLVLTRPEGGLFVTLILIWGWVKTRSFRLPFTSGIKTAILLAPVMILKRLYYGYWLPNTYYVKSGSGLQNMDLGKIYLIRNGLRYWPIVLLFILFLIFLFVRKKQQVIFTAAPLLIISAVWGAYVWSVGGDNLVGGRMLLPALPLIFVALTFFMQNSSMKHRWAVVLVTIIALIVFIGYTQNQFVQDHTARWRRNFPVRKAAGLYLKAHFPSDTLVALNPAGIIPYYSELPTIDMLGLNDEHIAHLGKRDFGLDFGHQAGDGDYILSRQPDVILFGGGVSAKPGDLISDREIAHNPAFNILYQPVTWHGIGTAYLRTDGNNH
ncbi:MAG: hypothetical protein GWN14_17560 [candidate division Zixibacteria bacterium]|nr:hypothetical protein [Gammaproteobacteria bacterium]NIX57674.1 hypothetical protein [candidate division Zixibacteria bacterium]